MEASVNFFRLKNAGFLPSRVGAGANGAGANGAASKFLCGAGAA
jgi:hypothetical protein